MTISSREIEKLASRAESFLASTFEMDITREKQINYTIQAISCLDTIIKNVPTNLRFPYVLQSAEMTYRAISWSKYAIAWQCLIPCTTFAELLSEDEVNKLVAHADSLLEEKKYKEALCFFDTLIKYAPLTAYYFSKRAICRFACNDKTGAVEDCTRAIELDPHRSEYYRYRAIFKESQSTLGKMSGEFIDDLLSDYTNAMQKDPTIAEVWMAILYLQMLRNDWDEVISLCGQSQPFVINSDHKALRAWVLCLALLLAGDSISEEDVRPLREASMIHEVFIEHIINHLLIFCREEKVPERINKEILDLNILMLDRMSDLDLSSRLCISLGLWEEALKVLDLFLSKPLDDDRGWSRKCEALCRLSRFEEAFLAYRNTFDAKLRGNVNKNSDEELLLAGFADRVMQYGQYEEALRQYSRLQRPYIGYWISRSVCHVELGRFAEAIEEVDKEISFFSNIGYAVSDAWRAKGEYLEKMARFGEALEAYSKAADADNDSTGITYGPYFRRRCAMERKAALLVNLGQYEQALNLLIDLYSLNFTYMSYGLLSSEMEMITLLDRIAEIVEPANTRIVAAAWFLKARIYSFCHEQEEARVCLAKAVELDRNHKKLAARDNLLKEL